MTMLQESPLLDGQMMQGALSIPAIMDYAADVHGSARILSATVEGGLHDYSLLDTSKRIARLAHGLRAMGIGPGDRVATLA